MRSAPDGEFMADEVTASHVQDERGLQPATSESSTLSLAKPTQPEKFDLLKLEPHGNGHVDIFQMVSVARSRAYEK